MPKRTSDYQSWLLETLTDPSVAANYLRAAMSDSEETFLIALRNIAEAHRMASVAKGAKVSRESLYRMLSKKGNPRYTSLKSILKALGLRLSVEPESESSSLVPTAQYACGKAFQPTEGNAGGARWQDVGPLTAQIFQEGVDMSGITIVRLPAGVGPTANNQPRFGGLPFENLVYAKNAGSPWTPIHEVIVDG